MDRREFLLATGSLSAAAIGCERRTATTNNLPIVDLDVTWNKAPCRYCGTGCGVEVGVAEGKVVAVRGDEKAQVNRGLLCAKGYHLPGMLYGEDRLTNPLLRRPDGKGF